MLRLTEPHHFSLTLSLGDTDPVAATWHVLGLSLLLDDAIPEVGGCRRTYQAPP